MFIKITKLQKWPKEDFALVTRPGGYPYFGRREVLEHASRTYSHATRAWQISPPLKGAKGERSGESQKTGLKRLYGDRQWRERIISTAKYGSWLAKRTVEHELKRSQVTDGDNIFYSDNGESKSYALKCNCIATPVVLRAKHYKTC